MMLHTVCRRLKFFTFPKLKMSKSFHVISPEPSTEFLRIRDSKSGKMREIPYKKLEGFRDRGIFYIPGFMSSKAGTKAMALHRFCAEYGFPYLRYDPTGMGESQSISLKDARLTHWIQDAKEMLVKLADRPQIIVASSMGAWIAMSLVEKYPEKFYGLVMIAPAPNMTQRYFDKMSKGLPESALDRLKQGGLVNLTHPDYGTFPVSYDLAEDMFQNELDLSKTLHINCPVRIIHGIKDVDIPYTMSLDLINYLHTSDVIFTFIKDGDHRLVKEENLQLLFDTILKLDATKLKANL